MMYVLTICISFSVGFVICAIITSSKIEDVLRTNYFLERENSDLKKKLKVENKNGNN